MLLSSLSDALNALSSPTSVSCVLLRINSSSKEEEQRSTQVLCSRLVSGVIEERVLILLRAPFTARHSTSPSLLRPSLLLWLLLLLLSLALLNKDFSLGLSPLPVRSICFVPLAVLGGESWSFLGGDVTSCPSPLPAFSFSFSSSSASDKEKLEARTGRSSKSALDIEAR